MRRTSRLRSASASSEALPDSSAEAISLECSVLINFSVNLFIADDGKGATVLERCRNLIAEVLTDLLFFFNSSVSISSSWHLSLRFIVPFWPLVPRLLFYTDNHRGLSGLLLAQQDTSLSSTRKETTRSNIVTNGSNQRVHLSLGFGALFFILAGDEFGLALGPGARKVVVQRARLFLGGRSEPSKENDNEEDKGKSGAKKWTRGSQSLLHCFLGRWGFRTVRHCRIKMAEIQLLLLSQSRVANSTSLVTQTATPLLMNNTPGQSSKKLNVKKFWGSRCWIFPVVFPSGLLNSC